MEHLICSFCINGQLSLPDIGIMTIYTQNNLHCVFGTIKTKQSGT